MSKWIVVTREVVERLYVTEASSVSIARSRIDLMNNEAFKDSSEPVCTDRVSVDVIDAFEAPSSGRVVQ